MKKILKGIVGLVFLMIFSCSTRDKAGEQSQITNRGSLSYLDAIKNRGVDVPLIVILESTPEIEWTDLDHWMFPVFERETKFDKIMMGKYRGTNNAMRVYLAIKTDGGDQVVKEVRINNGMHENHASPFRALTR